MTINQTTKTMYDNTSLAPMFDMEFYETLEVPTSAEYTRMDRDNIPVKVKRMYRINAEGKYEYTDVAATTTLSNGKTVLQTVSGYVNDARTGAAASYIPDQEVWDLATWNKEHKGSGTDYYEFKAQHIFILGKDALTRTGLTGQDQVKMYAKAKGSAGVLDPIDQRQSIGFKINSVGFGSTRLEAVVDYICVPSQVNSI